MYKFYDENDNLVMTIARPTWINWDPRVKSFKVCKYTEREGVLIEAVSGDTYEASIEGEIIHPQLPVVRMVIE